jgi:hypothetical protein
MRVVFGKMDRFELRKLYREDPCVRAIFDILAARQRIWSSTSEDAVMKATRALGQNFTWQDIRGAFRAIEEAGYGCARQYKGTNIVCWRDGTMIDVARAAAGDDDALARLEERAAEEQAEAEAAEPADKRAAEERAEAEPDDWPEVKAEVAAGEDWMEGVAARAVEQACAEQSMPKRENWRAYSTWMREDWEVCQEFPTDWTEDEAERMAAWIRSIPFKRKA